MKNYTAPSLTFMVGGVEGPAVDIGSGEQEQNPIGIPPVEGGIELE